MRNYFRIKNTELCFFFDDESIVDTTAAHKQAGDGAAALGEADGVVLYRPCIVEGPWNNTPLVGHRDRADILADISDATEVDDCVARSLELQALDARFGFVEVT